MVKAIVYEVGNDGQQNKVCVLEMRTGVVVPTSNRPLGSFVLSRPVVDPAGRKITVEDGEEFLRALPAAYSGSRVRVGLKETQ